MKVGGQTPWNVTPICETFKISYLMGKHHMIDVLGNHSEDRLFNLVHWLRITQKQRRTSQESVNLEKVLPGFFLGCALYAGGIWKGDLLVADLEELEMMDSSGIYSKRFIAKEVIFPKEGELFPMTDGRIRTLGENPYL